MVSLQPPPCNSKPVSAIPFLKWPGGKRWFVEHHAHLLPRKYGRYIEPFLGSGAVFFHLQPRSAILGDLNSELIGTYLAIRDGWEAIEDRLISHQAAHGHTHYYKVRESRPRSVASKASRMIYLNRTCFNGIYRVNQQGQFNVPKGSKTNVVLDTDDFSTAAHLLARARLRVADFELLIDEAKANDLIFADPPYTVRHNVNGFVKYNEKLFSWDDQIRLADALSRAKKRGAKIVSTNANHESVRSLYRARNFRFHTVSRYSAISADAESRKQFEELVIHEI